MTTSSAVARQEAITKIEATQILTVWAVTYEVREGRSWVADSKHHLDFAVAKNTVQRLERDAALGRKVRNVQLKPLTVYTHDYPA